MASLRRELRKELENAAIAARNAAVTGARKAIEALAVQNGRPWTTMSEEQKQLRNRLRAHGRQLGDVRNPRSDDQSIERLVQECAYEHWHRMLFARFLAECDLLIEPDSGVPISLDECRALALERGVDWLTLVSEFAVKMLSRIFRAGDPMLEVGLPPETRQELESLMKSLPREVFFADDSLGWVYQFWQAEKKSEVNSSGNKIGADELAPVTQLFTEDYMVLFLLHNTLGAWWAGKILAERPDLATDAKSEDELRNACAIGDVNWAYLRFVRDGEGLWRPAAGTFDCWPKNAKDLTILDPCMGSGHFLVFSLPMLVALRMAEEKIAPEAAIEAVLRDNLFGLELDHRCTQIAAFNLALTAWRMVGHRPLPPLNLACSGLGIHAKEEEWLELVGKDEHRRDGMAELYQLFKKGPILGSLINPLALRRPSPLLIADFHAIQPFLEAALEREERRDYEITEMTIAAQGMAKAAEILASQFTLVATNVPYLGRGKQDEVLQDYCEQAHSRAKADLATCFVERCLDFCMAGSSTALVTPQNWLFLGSYKNLRAGLLQDVEWNIVARLGPRAFETIGGEVVNVCLLGLTRQKRSPNHSFAGLEVSEERTPSGKAEAIRSPSPLVLTQDGQLKNPDCRLVLGATEQAELLSSYADSFLGLGTGDYSHYGKCFWEFPSVPDDWAFQQGSVDRHIQFGGRAHIVFWDGDSGRVRGMSEAERKQIHNQDQSGQQAWGKVGVCVSLNKSLPVTHYSGELFDKAVAVLVPKRREDLLPILAFAQSNIFQTAVRALDQKTIVANGTLLKVPFAIAHWQKVADEKYPEGLPKAFSSDPTQWLFNGHPKSSDQPLHVALARLVGYQWPRQTGSSFTDCPALGSDGLGNITDADGIVCLAALQGELSAADRLRALLAIAYDNEWSSAKQSELLSQVCGTSLDQWLRERFFEQHCSIFHNRPFVWHIWDGLRNGFHALVNYHRLAAPNGQGRRTLEKLIYSYLGDWIKQQRDDQKSGAEGAEARVAAAEQLKKQLELILLGDQPHDIFVRWKPLHEQPIGWDPDINDGVRLNIRPFMKAMPLKPRSKGACILRVTPKITWEKDRGKEPHRDKNDFPWFWGWDQSSNPDFLGRQTFDGNRWNDLHYSLKAKQSLHERNSIPKTAQKG